MVGAQGDFHRFFWNELGESAGRRRGDDQRTSTDCRIQES